MGYSPNSHDVRADFFTDDTRVKWKYTDVLDMEGFYDLGPNVHTAVAAAWAKRNQYLSLVMVVLDPYHKNGYPVMMTPAQREEILAEAREYATRRPS